ncbi:hypothetical protein M2103_001099 [Ereboglobus sp. PH5-5]|uniref:hypothetical protein n=1 Tax=unclassified Ereboglobus TaxID=2626932 RepID=UPI0024076C29|nr:MULTISPECIES: hypothetical protein [unclassified Ereboglobus]MDF9827753.1 hypothetical protein [Ereboglobus sp. PH5-10]MDF9832885.1 hypothetical protein [Ereboglobus sp. PH5-5]
MTTDLPRTLKISRRPLASFAVALAPLLVLAAVLFNQRGFQPIILFLALIPVVLYAAVIIIVFSQRITIRPDGIETVTLFRFRRFIRFSEIIRTEIDQPAGRDRPVLAQIHTKNAQDPVVALKLKALAPEDAAWLCALPELKSVRGST